MPVSIVADSSGDLPPELVKELAITVVPLNLKFGDRVYRDGMDISHEECYRNLLSGPVQPATSQPSPRSRQGWLLSPGGRATFHAWARRWGCTAAPGS